MKGKGKMKYLVDLEKQGTTYTLDNAGNSKKRILDYAKSNGYKVSKMVPAKGHHRCKYCDDITIGETEDILCEDCRMVFGHTLYSEL